MKDRVHDADYGSQSQLEFRSVDGETRRSNCEVFDCKSRRSSNLYA